ncbi:glucan biosynthesis protein D [Aquincola tertiaricarbonis]|uniref:Glucan biosynthesis protein D n=1 Tax=Aquincola tertiaricarbonis TaxID=391953 RepID=A0ABY4SFD1_AQUTE|nr:glucan biosynthesis protein D [Aquincola tertiaricarbonis]URI10860.1 glucan biosynthesis protein D [Aquincola tertiaricarbonis]
MDDQHTTRLDRRHFITAAGSALGLAALGLPAQAQPAAAAGLRLGPRKPFSFEALVARAEAMSRQAPTALVNLPREVLERIDYEAHGKLRFDTDSALFKDGPGPFPVTFFHMGRFFQTPVHMHVLDKQGEAFGAREILYSPRYFDMPADSPARELPEGAGFAGFRFQESRLGDQKKLDWKSNDWVAFLGASYFRAIGELYQYGLSARGVAINPAVPGQDEEFPSFTHFWFEPPAEGSTSVTVHALLEGPSITGAYRFVMKREAAVLMDVDARLFLRKDVARLGLAPLTSMYWYSETVKPTAIDWRPEVHDSDGLTMWNGAGERIWRPLNNPNATTASAFADNNPRGFGLWQRDRNFDHYLDGVMYDRRPGLWVEPLDGGWGEGDVQLIEIPTDDEIHDNTVAMWVPRQAAKAGSRYSLRYRLHWTDKEPYPTPLAFCTGTRLGRGGQPGQPRPAGVRKFMVEFTGGPLKDLPFGVKPEAVLSAASGKFSYVFTEAVPDGVPGHWRAQFDFTAEGTQPVDIRLYLRNGDQTLSETWLYQYRPF